MAKDRTAAERQRRYRERQRNRIQVLPVEITDEITSQLIDADLLTVEDAAKPGMVAEALINIARAFVRKGPNRRT